MKSLKVRIMLLEEALGMSTTSKQIYRDYLADKAPDAASRDEEIERIGVDAVAEKGRTVFPKDEAGTPFWWDYQLKGFLKDTCDGLRDFSDYVKKEKRLSKWLYKRTIDKLIFTNPRRIMMVLPEGGKIGLCERTLRAQTMQGERISLASSETVPAGTVFDVEFLCMDESLEKLVLECLSYGRHRGLGAWRNSGKGIFDYELIGK